MKIRLLIAMLLSWPTARAGTLVLKVPARRLHLVRERLRREIAAMPLGPDGMAPMGLSEDLDPAASVRPALVLSLVAKRSRPRFVATDLLSGASAPVAFAATRIKNPYLRAAGLIAVAAVDGGRHYFDRSAVVQATDATMDDVEAELGDDGLNIVR